MIETILFYYLFPRVENTGNIFKLLTNYSMSKEMSNEVLFPRGKKKRRVQTNKNA